MFRVLLFQNGNQGEVIQVLIRCDEIISLVEQNITESKKIFDTFQLVIVSVVKEVKNE